MAFHGTSRLNERTKYAATWFNNSSIACFVIGFITPGVQFSESLEALNTLVPTRDVMAPILSIVGWFVAAGVLHWMARVVLGRLRE
jgi:hypothetical protein